MSPQNRREHTNKTAISFCMDSCLLSAYSFSTRYLGTNSRTLSGYKLKSRESRCWCPANYIQDSSSVGDIVQIAACAPCNIFDPSASCSAGRTRRVGGVSGKSNVNPRAWRHEGKNLTRGAGSAVGARSPLCANMYSHGRWNYILQQAVATEAPEGKQGRRQVVPN